MRSTLLGKLLKKMRVEHNETIQDMAQKLEITPSYLSAIGIGKRPLPTRQLELLERLYKPTRRRQLQIFWAAQFSKTFVKISFAQLSLVQRQFVSVVAQKIAHLDSQTIALCYRSLQISPQTLRQWHSLFKQNQEFDQQFQEIFAAWRLEERRERRRRQLEAELESVASPSFQLKLRQFQDDLGQLRSLLSKKAAASSLYDSLYNQFLDFQNQLSALSQKVEALEREEAPSLESDSPSLPELFPPAEEQEEETPQQEELF